MFYLCIPLRILRFFRSFNIMNINLKFNSGDQTGTVCTTYRSNKKSEISGYSRQVLRLFMSTGLRFCIFALFPVYMSTRLCSYGAIFFYVVIFNLPTVYSILMYILWFANRYSILITHFTRIINRAWTLRIYKCVIISDRYTAIN